MCVAHGTLGPKFERPHVSRKPLGQGGRLRSPFIFADYLLEYNSDASEPWMVDGNSGHANALGYPAMIEIEPSPPQQLSSEASRMRRSRARRRRGETVLTLEVGRI
jgi:hypothetical protein